MHHHSLLYNIGDKTIFYKGLFFPPCRVLDVPSSLEISSFSMLYLGMIFLFSFLILMSMINLQTVESKGVLPSMIGLWCGLRIRFL